MGCISGALVVGDYVSRLKQAGFASVEVVKHPDAARQMIEVSGMEPPAGAEHLMSVNITASKAAACCSPACCSEAPAHG